MAETTDGLTQAAPVKPGSRAIALDVVRGFALLGILGPNIVVFAWPTAGMYDPEVLGGGVWNETAHSITSVFFFGKMMFLFALLFGAGVWFFDRKNPDGPLSSGAGLWYRRMGVLLVVGLAHGLGLWFGDILVWYAWCGLLGLWWMRRIEPNKQLVIGAALYAFGVLISMSCVGMAAWAVSAGHAAESDMFGDPQAEIKAYTGPYVGALLNRALILAMMYPMFLVPVFTFQGTGIMLAGLALVRKGVLTGERSSGFYAKAAAVLLPAGLIVSALGFAAVSSIEGPMSGMFWQTIGQPLGIATAMGYAATLIWLVKAGRLGWLTSALGAVGRMAFSNYLLQTLICTTLFYGHGFGLYASIDYPGLWGVMAGVWAVNIAFSVLWLRAFSIGPAEWLWRLATYGRAPAWR